MAFVEARAGLQCSLITFSGAATAACAKRDDGPAKTHTLLSSHTASRQQRNRCDTGQCLQLQLDGSAEWSLWRAVVKPVQPQELLELLGSSRTLQRLRARPRSLSQHHSTDFCSPLYLSQTDGRSPKYRSDLHAAASSRVCDAPAAKHFRGGDRGQTGSSSYPCQRSPEKVCDPTSTRRTSRPSVVCGQTSSDLSCHRVPTRPSCSALLPRPPKPGATGASV